MNAAFGNGEVFVQLVHHKSLDLIRQINVGREKDRTIQWRKAIRPFVYYYFSLGFCQTENQNQTVDLRPLHLQKLSSSLGVWLYNYFCPHRSVWVRDLFQFSHFTVLKRRDQLLVSHFRYNNTTLLSSFLSLQFHGLWSKCHSKKHNIFRIQW